MEGTMEGTVDGTGATNEDCRSRMQSDARNYSRAESPVLRSMPADCKWPEETSCAAVAAEGGQSRGGS
jgi:hypothetical protein